MAKNKTNTPKDERYSLKGSSFWGILIFAVLLIIDLVTKLWADAYFNAEGAPSRVNIIPGWIWLEIEYNPGISYGMGANAPEWAKILVIIATAVIMLALAVFYFKMDKRRSLLRLAFVFIVAGGVGNLIDRVYYRVWELDAYADAGVRDMVNLSRFGFAVCNFADFFITGGAVMMVLAMLFFDRDAVYPVGAKYRALAKEHEAEEERKKGQTQENQTTADEKNNG
jgi:signal peptidase II